MFCQTFDDGFDFLTLRVTWIQHWKQKQKKKNEKKTNKFSTYMQSWSSFPSFQFSWIGQGEVHMDVFHLWQWKKTRYHLKNNRFLLWVFHPSSLQVTSLVVTYYLETVRFLLPQIPWHQEVQFCTSIHHRSLKWGYFQAWCLHEPCLWHATSSSHVQSGQHS